MNDPQSRTAVPVETWEKIVLLGDVRRYDDTIGADDEVCSYLVALNNYALRPTHPSKITRDHLDALKQLRATAGERNAANASNRSAIDRLIDAIESILPPPRLNANRE